MTDTIIESRAPHGTRARYQAGCRDDCPATPTCTDRNNAYVAERRAARSVERTQQRATRPTKQLGIAIDVDVHELLARWAAEASAREQRHVTVTEMARSLLLRGVRDKARRAARRRAARSNTDTGDTA